jgi:replicative DNA helicase
MNNVSTLSNLEAEQALLGALISNNAVLSYCDGLVADHFSEPVHARIFDVASGLIRAGRTVSAIALKSHFENDSTLSEIGGTAYLGRLVASATTVFNAGEYSAIIKDSAVKRLTYELINTSNEELFNLGYDVSGTAFTAELASKLATLASDNEKDKSRFSLREALNGALLQTAEAFQNGGKRPDAITTGLNAIDGVLGGLVAETLVVLAGRPSMGKSTLSSVIAYNAAKAGVRTDFYTLDMTVTNMAQRIASMETRIPYVRAQWGKVSEGEFMQLQGAVNHLSTLPLSFVARAGMTLATVGAEIAKSKMRNPDLFLVVIDQLSQVSVGGKFVAQRTAEVTAITAGLKALAMRHKVCILLCHQLNRAADAREGNRPQLSDLRDSGSLEQDANVVIFPFREEYYLSRNQPKLGTPGHLDWQDKMRDAKDIVEIIIAKNSLGPIGSAKARCDLQINTISDLVGEDVELF